MRRRFVRILFVNEKCGYFGGVEQNIADSVAGLNSRGITSLLAYGEETQRGLDSYEDLFARTYHCRDLGSFSGSDHSHSFREIFNNASPDVVYFHKVPDLTFCLQLLDSVRSVRMVHDHDLCCPRRHKYYITNNRVCHHKLDWRCWLDGAFISRNNQTRTGFGYVNIGLKLKEMRQNYLLDTLLVGSRFMREELLQNGFSKEKVHILPPVVRMETHEPVPPSETPAILYVGQFIRGKGVDLLLQALKKIRGHFTADIIGTGNAEHKLKEQAKELGLEQKVTFHGWINNEDLGRFYSRAKVVAVPSRWPEPFGMIGLEAMHHSKPIVAFDVGGIPDWLEHGKTGFLAPEQDIDTFAQALERILTEKGLAENLGENGLRRVKEHFSFEMYLDKLISYLSE
jgi:glycosyltransferase involved in cell wall biosynthesis